MDSLLVLLKGDLIGARKLCEAAIDKAIEDGRHQKRSQINQIRKLLVQVIEELEKEPT